MLGRVSSLQHFKDAVKANEANDDNVRNKLKDGLELLNKVDPKEKISALSHLCSVFEKASLIKSPADIAIDLLKNDDILKIDLRIQVLVFKKIHEIRRKISFSQMEELKKTKAFTSLRYTIFTSEDLFWMESESLCTFDDWRTIIESDYAKDSEYQDLFQPLFDRFISITFRDNKNIEKYAKLLFINSKILKSDVIVRKLIEEKFFETLFNNKELLKNSELMTSVLTLFRERPELLKHKIKVKGTQEKIFFHLYKLGFFDGLISIIKSCENLDINMVCKSGHPLILDGVLGNNDDLIDAILKHNKFDPNKSLNSLIDLSKKQDQKRNFSVRNILFRIVYLIGREKNPENLEEILLKLIGHKGIDLKTLTINDDKGDSLLSYIADIASEFLLTKNGKNSKNYKVLYNTFEEILSQVYNDSDYSNKIASSDGVNSNILHAVAKIDGDIKDLFEKISTDEDKESLSRNFSDKLKSRDFNGHSPVEYALMVDNNSFINYILEQKLFDPLTLPRDEQFKLLICSARGGNSKIFERLLNIFTPDIIKMSDKDGRTLFHHAASSNIIKLLNERAHSLCATYLINKQDNEGQTPLAFQVSTNSIKNCKVLVECSADVNIPDNKGNSPLIDACINGYVEIVRLLTSAPYLDIDHKNKLGVSALHAATTRTAIQALSMGNLIHSEDKHKDQLKKESIELLKEIENQQVQIISALIEKNVDTTEYTKESNKESVAKTLLPAMQTFVFTSLRHTLFSTINLFMMGTRENPVYNVMDTYNKLAFVYDAHKNIEDAVRKAVDNLLGQALNYNVKLKEEITFSQFYVSNNYFYTSISDTKPTASTDHNDSALNYTANAIGNFFKNILIRVGILPSKAPEQVGLVNITESDKKLNKQNILDFANNYPAASANAEQKQKAKLILDTLLNNYLRITDLKNKRFFVFGADKMLSEIREVYSILLDKTKIDRSENFRWCTDEHVVHFIQSIDKSNPKRKYLLHHFASMGNSEHQKKNPNKYRNQLKFIELVINGKIIVPIEQYETLYEFYKDLKNLEKTLYDPPNTILARLTYVPFNLLRTHFLDKIACSNFGLLSESKPGSTMIKKSLDFFDKDQIKDILKESNSEDSFKRENIQVDKTFGSSLFENISGQTITELKNTLGSKFTSFTTFLVTNSAFFVLASRLSNAINIAAATIVGLDLIVHTLSFTFSVATTPYVTMAGCLYGVYKFSSYAVDKLRGTKEIEQHKESTIKEGTLLWGYTQRPQTTNERYANTASSVIQSVGGAAVGYSSQALKNIYNWYNGTSVVAEAQR